MMKAGIRAAVDPPWSAGAGALVNVKGPLRGSHAPWRTQVDARACARGHIYITPATSWSRDGRRRCDREAVGE